MDTVTLNVLKEDGWKYGKDIFDMGDQFTVNKDDLVHLQKYIDNGTIEVALEPRAIDAKKAAEIQATTIKAVIAPIMDDFKKAMKTFKVHGKYQDDPSFEDDGGFSNLAEFTKHVFNRDRHGGSRSEKLAKWESSEFVTKAATGMGEVVGADGGVLVPTAYRNQLMMNAVEKSIVFPRATFVPMASNAVEVPTVDVTSHASNLYGGVLAYWGDEGTAPTASKPAFGKIKLSLNSLKALAYVGEELMEDSAISLEGLLPSMFSTAISYQMDEKFLVGNGSGCPLGALNSPAIVSVAKETGQLATTIVTENLLKMWSRCYPPSQSNAVWIANIDTFVQLATLSLPVGTGGSTVGILREQTVQGNTVQTLLGRPIIFTEKVPTLGTTGDVMLCDFAQYVIGGKSATAGSGLQGSIHLKFDSFQQAFRISQRMDGQSWWRSALTPRNGSNTLSPFVKLDTRS